MSSIADRYLSRVLNQVIAPQARVERLRSDIESHFAEASERGESDADVIRRLGAPEEVAASLMAEIDLQYAGFWERLVAFLGDLGISLAVLVPIMAVCAMIGPGLEDRSQRFTLVVIGALVLFGLSIVGILLLYFPVLEHLYGKTFGKHALNLRVVSEQGAPIGLGTAFIRRLPLFFELLWLDALFIPFNEKKQRAFDIVAKTVVVREPDKARGIGSWLLCLAPWLLIAFVGAVTALLTAS